MRRGRPRRSPFWANGMPRRPQGPGFACWRGFALVTGAGMRYDAAAGIFGRFQPFPAADVSHL